MQATRKPWWPHPPHDLLVPLDLGIQAVRVQLLLHQLRHAFAQSSNPLHPALYPALRPTLPPLLPLLTLLLLLLPRLLRLCCPRVVPQPPLALVGGGVQGHRPPLALRP